MNLMVAYCFIQFSLLVASCRNKVGALNATRNFQSDTAVLLVEPPQYSIGCTPRLAWTDQSMVSLE